jgi:hypothetical protein
MGENKSPQKCPEIRGKIKVARFNMPTKNRLHNVEPD